MAEALSPGPDGHGLAWLVDTPTGRVWHNGRWLGAATHAGFHPQRGNWVIVLDNGGSLATDRIARELWAPLDALAEQRLVE